MRSSRLFRRVAPLLAASPALGQCEVWMPPGTPSGFLSPTRALAEWDWDGPGPETAALVVGGDFTMAVGGGAVVRLARWTGSSWVQAGPALNASVTGLATWDYDGPGPGPELLVATGAFTSAAQPNPNVIRVAVLAPGGASTWQSIGNALNGLVNALRPWDADGPGPQPPLLVVGGTFTTAAAATVNRVAAWDGIAWQALGSGVNGEVRDMATWDPDGIGPLHDHLVVCGVFDTAGGTPARYIARWDGTAWHAFGPPTVQSGQITDILNWDPDGPGPFQGVLVIAGLFTQLFGGAAANSIAFWDGFSWNSLANGVRTSPFPSAGAGVITTLSQWDADGPGPDYADLIVTGTFGVAGSIPATNIARWDGVTWRALGSGPTNTIVSAPWDPDGAGPTTPRILIGGGFASAGGQPASNLAAYGCPPPPPCYPDCDQGGTLTVADFGCFQTRFVAGDPYADCNADTILTVADFGCFQTSFVAGCP